MTSTFSWRVGVGGLELCEKRLRKRDRPGADGGAAIDAAVRSGHGRAHCSSAAALPADDEVARPVYHDAIRARLDDFRRVGNGQREGVCGYVVGARGFCDDRLAVRHRAGQRAEVAARTRKWSTRDGDVSGFEKFRHRVVWAAARHRAISQGRVGSRAVAELTMVGGPDVRSGLGSHAHAENADHRRIASLTRSRAIAARRSAHGEPDQR